MFHKKNEFKVFAQIIWDTMNFEKSTFNMLVLKTAVDTTYLGNLFPTLPDLPTACMASRNAFQSGLYCCFNGLTCRM